MRILTLKMPDEIQCLIVAHLSYQEDGIVNIGQAAIGLNDINRGEFEIQTDVNVHKNGGDSNG